MKIKERIEKKEEKKERKLWRKNTWTQDKYWTIASRAALFKDLALLSPTQQWTPLLPE